MSLLAKYVANSYRSQAKVKEFQGESVGFERTIANVFDEMADK